MLRSMVFQLRDASDQLLSHWTRSLKQSEDVRMYTEEFLEDLKSIWVREKEYQLLTELLRREEADLVYRYLDLQLSLRSSEERSQLHFSIELERELENYLKNATQSSLKRELALRSMEQVVGNWLVSLSLTRPSIIIRLNEENFGREMRHNLGITKKEESFKLSTSMNLFIEELLEKNDESLEYWNRVCTSLEQILAWEETLEGVLKSIQSYPSKELLDQENLDTQLELFEKELNSFYKQLGKTLPENILLPFPPIAHAIILGKFRKIFQRINDAYSNLTSTLLQEPVDLHLCCTCHFGEEQNTCWDEKKRLLDLSDITPFYPDAKNAERSALVFTCGGGKGHLSVTKAISEYAKGRYHVYVADTLEETLSSTDVFKRMLFNFSQERLYNHLLRNEEFEWLKLLTSLGPFFLMMQQESIEKQIRLEVLKHNPDLLVSCFPCLNAMFLNVAKELNLPLIMVTTDLDTALFSKGMHDRSCDLNYPKWRMTLSYDTPEMRAIIEKRIPPNRLRVTGFPVRTAFNRPISDVKKCSLIQQFNIQPEDQVLLVMIGGVAGRATEKYATILAALSEEDISQLTEGTLHVICLCGDQGVQDNREMCLRIDNLKPATEYLQIHSIGALDDIAALMSIADGLITRPGGCTTNEALTLGLPMIFHAPFALMEWEVFNMEFCIEAEMGSRFKPHSHKTNVFQDAITKNKERLLPLIQQAFSRRKKDPKYAFDQKNFGKEFLKLVEELIN